MFMLQDIVLNKVIYSAFSATSSELSREKEHHHRLLFVVMVKISGLLRGVRMSVSLECHRKGASAVCTVIVLFMFHPQSHTEAFIKKKKKSWNFSELIELN